MKVIGFSGLDTSVAFKHEHFPKLDSRAYRITQGFDSAAALVVDGEVVAAAAEERFSRDKATGAFPEQAIRFCLERGKCRLDQVDYFAHGFNYESLRAWYEASEAGKTKFHAVFSRQVQERLLTERLGLNDVAGKLICVPHHLAHAASAWYPSGFSEALVLVSDGMGESQSMSVFSARGHELTLLKEVPATHSLGVLYGIFTLYLGFKFNMDEYKVMGLAPHGDPGRYLAEMRELVKLKHGGTWAIPILQRNASDEQKEDYSGTLAELAKRFGPAVSPDGEIEQQHKDLAAALQCVLEEATLHALSHFAAQTGHRNLCLAGGVALNCTANGKILRSGLFKDLFIQPAAGDDGSALGAALYVQHTHHPATPARKMSMPLWGPEYDDERIRADVAIPKGFQDYRFEQFADLVTATAKRLAEGKVCAWFQGRMEFGPRALGARSILADPRPEQQRERINRIIKKREGFRPFAPAVTKEAARTYFDFPEGKEDTFAHMLYTCDVREAFRAALPAITHIDGSARVQTVSREGNEGFWQLLNAFEKFSGFPVLLNTSFNVQEPIVCTPKDAFATFAATDIDFLVLGRKLLIERVK